MVAPRMVSPSHAPCQQIPTAYVPHHVVSQSSRRRIALPRFGTGQSDAWRCRNQGLGLSRRIQQCDAAKGAAAAALAAAPPSPPPPTQDPEVIYKALVAPVASLFGGEASWQYYLARRFSSEVLSVVVVGLAGYWLLAQMARRSAEAPAGRGGGPTIGGSEAVFMAAEAMMGPVARLLLGCVLAINVLRNSTYIVDGFITKFNPQLPNDWLDDLVRLLVQSLTPLDLVLTKLSLVTIVLFGCVVLLRWKDIAVAHYVLPHLETFDKGPELVQNFVNPASNLLNWVVIMACAVWTASALGLNLKPMLAVGGASGIIIGLATQQVLSNFVSGLNIFLARPFVAGEYISLVSQNLASQTNVSGRVIRVDPMRTLIATEDNSTITVPNQVIAVSIVVNRSRAPHWSVGRASQMLASPRELRWRMKLPHSALDKLGELEARIASTLVEALPDDKVRHYLAKLVVVKFIDSGAELSAKVNLAWRLGSGGSNLERMDLQEDLIQTAMLSLQKVVRSFDGTFLTPM